MKQIFQKILNALFSRKGALILSAFAVIMLVPDLAFAATPTSSTSGDNSETVQAFAETLSIVVTFLNAILWPLLLAIGDLMDVDMIIGPGMESRLLDIWVQIRNLVNIAFVLVLLVVAFYNVLGLGGGEGELAIKTALPKIIIGLVLVNFTYVGGRVILDVANVGTTIAFGLPKVIQSEQADSTTGYSFDSEMKDFERSICFKPEESTTGTDSSSTSTAPKTYLEAEAPLQTKIFCEYNESTSAVNETIEDGSTISVPADSYGGLRNSLKQQYFSDLNKNNVAIIMAVNMGNLGQQNLLKKEEINSFTDLTVNLIFSTVMYLVFAVSYVVLAIILLVRVVVLWLALAFSPIAVLIYVVPQIKEWLGGGGDFSQKVIKHLIAPIIVGFTLSMGFLLMSAWNQVGASTSGYKSSEIDEVISNGLLITGIDDLPKLILAIASIVVVWMGVFSAAEGTYAETITGKIKDVGTQVKDFAFKLPMMAPLLPVNAKGDKTENTSLMAMGSVLNSGFENFEQSMLQGQVANILDNSPALRKLAGDRAYEDRSLEGNRTKIRELLADKESGSSFTKEEAQELARSLMHVVENNTDLDKDEKAKITKELLDAQKGIERGDFTELRRVVVETGAEALSMTTSDFNTIKNANKVLTEDEEGEKPKKDDKKEKEPEKEEVPDTSTKPEATQTSSTNTPVTTPTTTTTTTSTTTAPSNPPANPPTQGVQGEAPKPEEPKKENDSSEETASNPPETPSQAK